MLLNKSIFYPTVSAIIMALLIIVAFASAMLRMAHEYGVAILFYCSAGIVHPVAGKSRPRDANLPFMTSIITYKRGSLLMNLPVPARPEWRALPVPETAGSTCVNSYAARLILALSRHRSLGECPLCARCGRSILRLAVNVARFTSTARCDPGETQASPTV